MSFFEDKDGFEYASVDSTPRHLSHNVPLWYAPGLLLLFALISTLSLYAITHVGPFKELFPTGDLVLSNYDGTHSISVRIFILSYFVAYAAFCHANPVKKLTMGLDLCLSFLLICASFDVSAVFVERFANVSLPLTVVQILSGLIGLGIYAAKILERGRMPESVAMEIDTSRNLQTLTRAGLFALYCAWLAVYVSNLDLSAVITLRDYALLGGIGPGVFLFLPAFFGLLFIGGLVDHAQFRLRSFAPDISIVIPAHNESHIIADALRGIEVAAEQYEGSVTVIVVDNASTDDTVTAVRKAADEMTYAAVQILHAPEPGKANALNKGLDAVKTEFFIRIDADTRVRPRALRRGMTYFFNEEVGAVGGLPLVPGGGLFDRARAVECVVKHGMYSVGLAAINGIVGIPGMFVIFRTELPRKLGGFKSGMNGEDTEMSLRIGELGYRLIVDPEVRYVSEVPRTFAHMREQRLRWFRSTYHVAARCRAVVFGPELSLRGKIILPYMLLNSSRRAMMLPLVLFGVIEYVSGFKEFGGLEWQAVLAVALGAPILFSLTALILNGYFRQILFLPEYMIFRLLRAYFTLESNLSINLKNQAENLYADENAKATIIAHDWNKGR